MRLDRTWIVLALLGLAAAGCDGNGGTDAGTDAGPPGDSGPPASACPTTNVPAPEELMGACCWRHEQTDQHDAPELRLTYLELTEPVGSPLSSTTLRQVLNEAMQDETFNWLFRVEGAAADGDVTIVTGFGRRNADGTYNFSGGAADSDPDTWCPVSIPATLAGETVNSTDLDGAITVPVFDDAGETLQVELVLRALSIQDSTWTENRSCIGAKTARPFTYTPDAQLTAFIEVERSRTQMINVPPVVTTVCAAIAGALDDATYCEMNAQGDWLIPPDSLCNDTGCQRNAEGMSDVCDPATTCNAWRVVGGFAAAGVDIANGTCGG
ncbi:MAG: hypothetical protein KC619_13090 [Myxococcales bacterium]|nr:hypothetical protein [Myxococcales bacterium]